jgi:hypothetical protein
MNMHFKFNLIFPRFKTFLFVKPYCKINNLFIAFAKTEQILRQTLHKFMYEFLLNSIYTEGNNNLIQTFTLKLINKG